MNFEVDGAARDWLALHGYDRQMGARPMAHLVKDRLKKPLANELLFGTLTEGGKVTVTVENGELRVDIVTACKVK